MPWEIQKSPDTWLRLAIISFPSAEGMFLCPALHIARSTDSHAAAGQGGHVWKGGFGRDGCPKGGQAKWTLPHRPHSYARRFLCQDTSDFSEDDVSNTAQLRAGLHWKAQPTSCSCQWLVWNVVVGLPPHKPHHCSPRGSGTGTILLHTENISRDLFPVQIERFWLSADSALYIFTNRIIAACSFW